MSTSEKLSINIAFSPIFSEVLMVMAMAVIMVKVDVTVVQMVKVMVW
jgi:hypothetical protein